VTTRICPRCGHVDPIWWRPAVYHQEFSYAHNTALVWNDPELWAALRPLKRGEIIKRGPFFYWKSTRSDTTRRVWIEDYRLVRKKGSPQEKVRRFEQLKLKGSR